jgi:hypothetical protein
MVMEQGGVGFCPPETQTHKVGISPYPPQFSTGTKIKNSISYPTGFGYPYFTIPPYEFLLYFGIIFIKKRVKIRNYFFSKIFIQRK